MFSPNAFGKIALITGLCFIFSCAKSEKNDLKDTQLCLNSAPASQAMACTNKIASDFSAQAYKLRCSAIFISEGFNTPSSFVDALEKINNPTGTCTGGCSPTVGAITALTFKNANNASATDLARSSASANLAFSYCSLAETGIYMQISSLFKIGTLTANLAYAASGGGALDENQIKTQLANLSNADMGSLAVSTYSATCQNLEKASVSTKIYCAELGTAVNSGGTEAAIGACFKAKLANPSSACP